VVGPFAAADQDHVWHPYTQHGLTPSAVPILRAEGALLYDQRDRPIIDAISSWWVTLHGHAHPTIADAVARQARVLEQVIFAGFTHEPAAQLAAELVARLPASLTRIFYSDDGSTAVEVALKVALQFWQQRGQRRSRIAALTHAYHGDTFGAMSASSGGLFTAPFAEQLFNVVRLPAPPPSPELHHHGHRSPSAGAHDDVDSVLLDALDRALADRADPLAAVIVEPLLQGAGGMRVWDAALLRAVRERTAAAGVLLIADEVLTGFGRTGPLFACDGAGVQPDMMCLSKGLTGGFLPLGATAVREELFDAFRSTDRRRTFFHGHSFTANPIACAAARASLALLDDRCAIQRDAIERSHRAHVGRLASHSWIQHPRVLGTIAAFDLVPPGDGSAAGRHDYLDPLGRHLSAFALDAGVLLRPLGEVVYILPPYSITPPQLDRVYEVIADFLTALDQDAVRELKAGTTHPHPTPDHL
jgi:adenosylmethionine---8-amino-7-oxononanoate aminotransferase